MLMTNIFLLCFESIIKIWKVFGEFFKAFQTHLSLFPTYFLSSAILRVSVVNLRVPSSIPTDQKNILSGFSPM